MSDGPHRSLPMRRPWKILAKRADQSTYDDEQIAEAAVVALASDFKNEIKWSLIDALKSIFTGRDNSLGLPEVAMQQLEQTKPLAAGSVFGMNVVAWGIELINEGRFGLDAFHDVIGLAAKMRGFANVRSMEEHYIRESNERRADHMSRRLQSTICRLSESTLGSILVTPENARIRRHRKKTGLDEGVPF